MQSRGAGPVVRLPAVAGSFYPADASALRSFIDGALAKAQGGALPKALIVPHAGYAYSGGVAAKGYALLAALPPALIVLVGPAHHVGFNGCVTSAQDWKTPLGVVTMSACPGLVVMEDAFWEEHSLEVQLPFIQRVAPGTVVRMVLVGDEDQYALAKILEHQKGMIIVSSDLSHFLPYERAQRRDKQTIDAILRLDANADIDACGAIGIRALLLIARKRRWKPQLIEYKNSGDTAGDNARVVGYAAIAFY